MCPTALWHVSQHHNTPPPPPPSPPLLASPPRTNNINIWAPPAPPPPPAASRELLCAIYCKATQSAFPLALSCQLSEMRTLWCSETGTSKPEYFGQKIEMLENFCNKWHQCRRLSWAFLTRVSSYSHTATTRHYHELSIAFYLSRPSPTTWLILELVNSLLVSVVFRNGSNFKDFK